jgi:hypothetical protein
MEIVNFSLSPEKCTLTFLSLRERISDFFGTRGRFYESPFRTNFIQRNGDNYIQKQQKIPMRQLGTKFYYIFNGIRCGSVEDATINENQKISGSLPARAAS